MVWTDNLTFLICELWHANMELQILLKIDLTIQMGPSLSGIDEMVSIGHFGLSARVLISVSMVPRMIYYRIDESLRY